MIRLLIAFGAIFLFAINVFAQIEGDVLTEKDKPIPGATISAILSDGKIAATAKSDDRGFYELKGLKRGKYKVEATASGYEKAVFEDVEVYAESEKEHRIPDVSNATRLQIILKSVSH